MLETGYIAVFIIGLLGGAHCIGMCGGIVSAFSARVSIVAVGTAPRAVAWRRQLAYNFGRIASYTFIGGAVGALGSATLLFNRFLPVQMALYILANVMLVCMGIYLVGYTAALAGVEKLGKSLWRRLQPLSVKYATAPGWQSAVPFGFLWGFLPCGLTYSILSTALVSGSALRGAGLMLSFGLGTLPNLLLAGVLLAKYRGVVRSRTFRLVAGLIVMSFGVYGLLRASDLGGKLWAGVVCIV